jgi:flagellum-specific ATP synthase
VTIRIVSKTAHQPSEDALAASPTPHALDALAHTLASLAADEPKVAVGGRVTEVTSAYCRVAGLSHFVKLGECVDLRMEGRSQLGEVVRIDADGVTVKPYGAAVHVGLGTAAWRRGFITLHPHPSWKGRTINALGQPIDGAGTLLQGDGVVSTEGAPPAPMRRQRIRTPVQTGVKVIDVFAPLCAGQRIGIFAGSGIGKSTLLAMLARSRGFDTVVVALVGERGREVREFMEDALRADRQRAVAVVATGDESPMMRRLAPKTAMSIAEYFRDRGDNVLLIIDSVTRFAHAARDVALAAGEPPVSRGYTPSVFSDLPKFLERAGPGEKGSGSITGIFTVLVDGDDHNDPVADSIRGTLDGHIVLDRAIADQARYPAVNVLASVSRLAKAAWTPEQAKLAMKLRAMVARFEDTRDLRLMGGYRAGADPALDKAIELVPKLYETMKQSPDDPPSADAFQDLALAFAADPAPSQPLAAPTQPLAR